MKTPFVSGYWPVMMLARAGQHTGQFDVALSKLMLSCANLSSTGVVTFGSPLYPMDCARHSSAMMNSRFGCRLRGAATSGAPAVAAAVFRKSRRFITTFVSGKRRVYVFAARKRILHPDIARSLAKLVRIFPEPGKHALVFGRTCQVS